MSSFLSSSISIAIGYKLSSPSIFRRRNESMNGVGDEQDSISALLLSLSVFNNVNMMPTMRSKGYKPYDVYVGVLRELCVCLVSRPMMRLRNNSTSCPPHDTMSTQSTSMVSFNSHCLSIP